MTLMRRSKAAAWLLVGASTLAACGGGDDQAGGNGDSAGGSEGVVEVLGTDALAFQPEELTATAGEVVVELTSGEGVLHTFAIDETDDVVVEAAAGATATGTVDLEPGEYTFYCDVPGHREAGMEGTLTVVEG